MELYMTERKDLLLKEIVEVYIKTIKPVSSKSLVEKFKCSSATIRNEMAELEKLKLLEKHHISSGRIPSEKGYKYYVANLMEPDKLSGTDVLKLQRIFSNKELVISDAIQKSMDIISDLTNYTSVTLGKNSDNNLLKKVDIIHLSKSEILAIVATDKGIVEKKKFVLEEHINIKEVIKVSEIINNLLVNTPISKVSERLELEIKPIIKKEITKQEAVYNIFYKAFTDFVKDSQNYDVRGRSKIINHPEYHDVEELLQLTTKLDDVKNLKKITDIKSDDVSIYIGSDNLVDENISIIKKSYKAEGEEGTIAILGPKRMDYSKIVGLLNIIDESINERNE